MIHVKLQFLAMFSALRREIEEVFCTFYIMNIM